ncbi:MAG: ATP synthase F1 subunit epsilon [Planctomycetaceae bacterium]|nr:ATP synthase F1 subunit epsilon [Planctomycetales bacterium]MCB9875092.1 ATP synthase F1 subunit epsilon [Planctomycetaceae bacterium]MCB9941039.1 ATP synthase F1 subunit epsilon [Planctomycetaceae bacterium]
MAELNCIVVTPEKTALETKAEFVAMPLYDGEIGILPGHSPMIGRLGYGEMRIRAGGKETRYYVDGGFVQVADNVVSILTNRAVLGTNLDAAAAREQLAAANKRRATTDDELALRDRLVVQARAQIHVAERSK